MRIQSFLQVNHWLKNIFQQSNQPAFILNFARDPVANSIAVVVLLFMIISAIGVIVNTLKEADGKNHRWPNRSVPIMALLGIAVASYLLYVEWTGNDAVCGPAGDCNAVQESPYAKLFGFLPVGLLGIVGYAAIFIAWVVAEIKPSGSTKFHVLLVWGMAWFGVAFSIYLTFLEPFIIGATCMWCITSAILMTLILLASTGPVKDILKVDEGDLEEEEILKS